MTPPSDSLRPTEVFGAAGLCSREALLATVLLAELLAILLTLAESSGFGSLLNALALNSLFVLWVTLASTALLCTLERRLRVLGPTRGLLVAYVGILMVAWILSEAAWQLAAPAFTSNSSTAQDRWHFLARNLGLTAIIAAISLRYLYLQYVWRERLLSESAARIAALQARIRPHFLFNSLNSIAALIRIDPQAAEQAVLNLSDLFRASLQAHVQRVSLDAELAVCEHYLAIEALRLGSRLQIDWQIHPDARAVEVPSLILQPLVENAVYHGIEPLTEGGSMRIEARCEAANLVLLVSNPRPPATPLREGRHQGMALQNIRERLFSHYEKAATLAIVTEADRFEVCLRLPLPSPSRLTDARPHR